VLNDELENDMEGSGHGHGQAVTSLELLEWETGVHVDISGLSTRPGRQMCMWMLVVFLPGLGDICTWMLVVFLPGTWLLVVFLPGLGDRCVHGC
jgi:hypothetical protein